MLQLFHVFVFWTGLSLHPVPFPFFCRAESHRRPRRVEKTSDRHPPWSLIARPLLHLDDAEFFTVKTVAKVGRNPTRKTGFEKLVMLTFKTKGYGYAFGNLPEMGCFSSLEKVEQSIYYISTCFAGLVSCQFFLGVCLCALLGCPFGILRIKGDVRISGL